jgi:hypothetical protein
MLEHLTALKAEDFMDLDDMDATATLDAQAGTADFFTKFGSPPELISEDSAQLARDAFAKVTNPVVSDADKKTAVLTLKVPHAVKHLAGMLSQYDWDYVEQAKEIRGYVVAKIMDETKHPDARIRLKSLELLGKLTEVGSFTERIEIKKVDATADELTERLRAKLSSLLPRTVEVQTIEARDADGG